MYDADEQEKIDAIKSWWRQNGKLTLYVVFAAVLALAALLGYRQYQGGQAEKASILYDELLQSANDLKKTASLANSIVSSYPHTAYAARAALLYAKAAVDAGDMKQASSQLNWVVDNADEPEIKDIARLQQARILLDEKKYPEALALLDAKHGDSFDGLYSALKGDIYLAQKNTAQARSSYVLAQSKLDKGSPYHNLLQIKLDSMGEGK